MKATGVVDMVRIQFHGFQSTEAEQPNKQKREQTEGKTEGVNGEKRNMFAYTLFATNHLVRLMIQSRNMIISYLGFRSVLMLFSSNIIILSNIFNSDADHSTWTSMEFLAELFFNWIGGSGRPASGSLVEIVTKAGQTSVNPM